MPCGRRLLAWAFCVQVHIMDSLPANTAAFEAWSRAAPDLAVDYDMEEEVDATRELSDFVTQCRDAQRTWKVDSH